MQSFFFKKKPIPSLNSNKGNLTFTSTKSQKMALILDNGLIMFFDLAFSLNT